MGKMIINSWNRSTGFLAGVNLSLNWKCRTKGLEHFVEHALYLAKIFILQNQNQNTSDPSGLCGQPGIVVGAADCRDCLQTKF